MPPKPKPANSEYVRVVVLACEATLHEIHAMRYADQTASDTLCQVEYHHEQAELKMAEALALLADIESRE